MTKQEAAKMLGRLLLYCECPHNNCEKCVEAITMAEEALEQQPKRGHWTDAAGKPDDSQYSLYCSECDEWSEYRSRYCSNCGARMEGD